MPGLKKIRSVVSYHSLTRFEFEINSKIDGYSCYIELSYVEVLTQTKIIIYC